MDAVKATRSSRPLEAGRFGYRTPRGRPSRAVPRALGMHDVSAHRIGLRARHRGRRAEERRRRRYTRPSPLGIVGVPSLEGSRRLASAPRPLVWKSTWRGRGPTPDHPQPRLVTVLTSRFLPPRDPHRRLLHRTAKSELLSKKGNSAERGTVIRAVNQAPRWHDCDSRYPRSVSMFAAGLVRPQVRRRCGRMQRAIRSVASGGASMLREHDVR